MPSLGYLLLLSLAVALICPSSGFFRPQCPKVVNSCQALTSCKADYECRGTQSCCDSGCGLRCVNSFFNFFANILSCGGGGCGQSSSRCSSGGCGQSSGQSSGQYGGQYERQYGGGGGFFGKKKK